VIGSSCAATAADGIVRHTAGSAAGGFSAAGRVVGAVVLPGGPIVAAAGEVASTTAAHARSAAIRTRPVVGMRAA
jgi:hypothetical protein